MGFLEFLDVEETFDLCADVAKSAFDIGSHSLGDFTGLDALFSTVETLAFLHDMTNAIRAENVKAILKQI